MADPWIETAIVAWLLALVLRLAGATARAFPQVPVRSCGWILCALASWLAASTAGAWVPLWIILMLGTAGAVAGHFNDEWWLRSTSDGVFLLVVFLASTAPVTLALAIPCLIIYVCLGFIIDAAISHIPRWIATAAATVPVILLTYGLGVDYSALMPDLLKADPTFPVFLGVALPAAGEPVTLDDRNVAWVLRQNDDRPEGGVLLLHGADEAGAHQKTAYVLQRAFLRSGYTVVSLDHPGYGASRYPDEQQPPSAWDPLPAVRSAYDVLDRELPHEAPRIVVGHSMGASDVLRLLGDGASPDLAVLMGGSMPDSADRYDYWYDRFHDDRNMTWRLPEEDWIGVWERYYGNHTLVNSLSLNHPPVLFVEFDIEWSNIRSQRSELWEAIPGQKHREELALTTHYMNSFYIRPGFVRRWVDGKIFVADTRGVSRLMDLVHSSMRRFHHVSKDADGMMPPVTTKD